MSSEQYLLKLFLEFQQIPVGYFIDNPKGLVLFPIPLSKKFTVLLRASDCSIFFTRMSLKHVVEKGYTSQSFLDIVSSVLSIPDEVRKAGTNRFIFSKTFHSRKKGYRPYAIALEVGAQNIIVTLFKTNPSYLKNFEILWRTEIP